MILKRKYKLYNSKTEHFEHYYKLYLKNKLQNEDFFINDLVYNLEFVEIEGIIEKYNYINQTKTNELISFLDKSSSFSFQLDAKLNTYYSKFNKITEEHFYPSLIIYFTKQLYKYEDLAKQEYNLKQTKALYISLLKTIKQRIVLHGNQLLSYLLGLKNFDVKDALAAYLIFDIKEANIIFEKAMIANSGALRLQFEILLSDWVINLNNESFIPRIKFVSIDNIFDIKVFEIEKIPYNELIKRLNSFKYIDRPFIQNHLFNINDVRNEVLFKGLLKDLFKVIDKSITKSDVEIFYYSLTQVNPNNFSNEQMVQTQNKVNKSFIDNNIDPIHNKKANKLLCAFIYKLKVYRFIKANSLTDALDEYFIPEVQLSKYTFNKYIYDNRNGSLIYDEMKDIIDTVVPDSILRNKKPKKTHLL